MYGDYRPSYHTIEPHDGMIYVVAHDYASDVPEEVLSWYATDIQVLSFTTRYGADKLGYHVVRDRYGCYVDINGRIVLHGTESIAERTTRQPVPCPKHRKSKRPIGYKNGWWYRESRQGWERL